MNVRRDPACPSRKNYENPSINVASNYDHWELSIFLSNITILVEKNFQNSADFDHLKLSQLGHTIHLDL